MTDSLASYLISTAITPNKVIAGVVLLIIVIVGVAFYMRRRAA